MRHSCMRIMFLTFLELYFDNYIQRIETVYMLTSEWVAPLELGNQGRPLRGGMYMSRRTKRSWTQKWGEVIPGGGNIWEKTKGGKGVGLLCRGGAVGSWFLAFANFPGVNTPTSLSSRSTREHTVGKQHTRASSSIPLSCSRKRNKARRAGETTEV